MRPSSFRQGSHVFKGGAGRLNRLITLQRLSDGVNGTKNSFGEVTADPTNALCNIRAAYEPVGGREFPESQKRHAETTARFRIRYRPDIDVQRVLETHQITYVEDYDASSKVTRTYDIKHAAVYGRREEIHFEVDETR